MGQCDGCVDQAGQGIRGKHSSLHHSALVSSVVLSTAVSTAERMTDQNLDVAHILEGLRGYV